MILSDFHTHSIHSGDSNTEMVLQAEAALNAGLKHLCFTEHYDTDYPTPPKGHEILDFSLDKVAYREDYLNLKNTLQGGCAQEENPVYDKLRGAGEKDGLNIYYGLEIGLIPEEASHNYEFVKDEGFDFIIASTHLFDGVDPFYKEYWEGKKDEEVIQRYFEYIYENICAFNDFDVCGHLDYIVRYAKEKDAHYTYSVYADVLDAILKKLIEMGKGLEINTGGLKNGLQYPNPRPDVLMRYRELGGEIITVGSDAHQPKFIGYKFDVAEDILNDVGFKYYTIFRERKPEFIKL